MVKMAVLALFVARLLDGLLELYKLLVELLVTHLGDILRIHLPRARDDLAHRRAVRVVLWRGVAVARTCGCRRQTHPARTRGAHRRPRPT